MFICSVIGLLTSNIDWGVATDVGAIIIAIIVIGTLLFVVNCDCKVVCC